MESALMVYAYALDHLEFRNSHFEVRRGNERVWQFHERFGAKRVDENEVEYIYFLEFDEIRNSLGQYSKFLPNGVNVEYI